MLSNNPRRMPLPVWIEYDAPGGRRRKSFNGLTGAARSFYARKLKSGKNPKVLKHETSTTGEKQ